MKKFAIALALLPSAFAGILTVNDIEAQIEAVSAEMMAHNEFLSISPLASEEAPLSFTEKALRSIRGLYNTIAADDELQEYTSTPNQVCQYGLVDITSGCYSTPSLISYGGYEVGPCATCYGSEGVALNSIAACYTCNTGYTLMTLNNASSPCIGYCLKDADFTAWEAATGLMPIETSECFVLGGCYPVDCTSPYTTGICHPTKSEAAASCFSGSDTVTLESGASKALSEVRVGDMILSADAKGELSFSGVVALPHGANADAATFFDVATASGKHVKATEMHLLKTCSGALAYAGSLKQGDCLRTVDGDEAVVSVETVQGKGLYTVVTMNEFPVISGIVASPFAVTHGFGNAYYNIHRALYKFAPALMQSSAVASANALVGTAVMLAAGFFNSGSN